jgi:hypothetical protein
MERLKDAPWHPKRPRVKEHRLGQRVNVSTRPHRKRPTHQGLPINAGLEERQEDRTTPGLAEHVTYSRGLLDGIESTTNLHLRADD